MSASRLRRVGGLSLSAEKEAAPVEVETHVAPQLVPLDQIGSIGPSHANWQLGARFQRKSHHRLRDPNIAFGREKSRRGAVQRDVRTGSQITLPDHESARRVLILIVTGECSDRGAEVMVELERSL